MERAAEHDETRGGEFIRVDDLLIRAEYVKLLRAHGLSTLESLFAYQDGECLSKPGLQPWRERIRVTLRNQRGEEEVFYLKRYTAPPAAEQRDQRWSSPQADSTAGLEWHWMLELLDAGIACAQPVAFGEQVEEGREARSATVSREVPGQSLETWGAHRDGVDLELIRHLGIHLARLVGRLHRRGFVHRDLYLSHVYFDAEAPLERALHLIDLQRVLQPRLRHLRWIIKDLAALNYSTPAHLCSNSERIRWLKRYLLASRLDLDHKWLVARIAAKTRRIARHDRNRNARLKPRSNGS